MDLLALPPVQRGSHHHHCSASIRHTRRESTSLDDFLPPDLIQLVFQFLWLRELRAFAAVSRRCRGLAQGVDGLRHRWKAAELRRPAGASQSEGDPNTQGIVRR